jgi:dienelactone hydrolase
MPPPRKARKSPALLVLPGWDDDGRRQFDALQAQLAPSGWLCRRADIPDAGWPAEQRARVSRDQVLHRVLEDYMNLAAMRGVARSRLALLGFSFGAYMATFLAAAKPARLLVLRSPAIYPDSDWSTPKEQLDAQALRAYRSRPLGPDQNRSLWCCSQFKGDVLLVDSGEDEIIPPQLIASYAGAFRRVRSLTRYTLADADHALTQPAWQREYHHVLVEWLSARMRQA